MRDEEVIMVSKPSFGWVCNVIATQFAIPVSEVVPEARLVEDLNADSLDMIELLLALEDEFGREVSDEIAERVVTVSDCWHLYRTLAFNESWGAFAMGGDPLPAPEQGKEKLREFTEHVFVEGWPPLVERLRDAAEGDLSILAGEAADYIEKLEAVIGAAKAVEGRCFCWVTEYDERGRDIGGHSRGTCSDCLLSAALKALNSLDVNTEANS